MEELIDILQGKTKTHKFTAGALQVVMRTLKEKELDDIYRDVGLKATSEVGADLLRRRHILARAIISVNGIPTAQFTEVQKLMSENNTQDVHHAIFQVLSDLSPQSLGVLWACYVELVQLDEKEKSELKKDLVNSLLLANSSGESTKKQAL